MKVKTFDNCFCSQKLFASIINKTPAAIYYFHCLGIVKICAAGVLIARSLRGYFNSYLPPNIRRAEIKAAVGRIIALDAGADTESDFLQSARLFQKKVDAAKMKLSMLKFLNKLDSIAAPPNLIDSAELQLQLLKAELESAKQKLRRVIIAANIRPLQIENILLYRYVDCEKFSALPTINGYSKSHCYLLHKQGRKLFHAFAQVSE